jgi:hypothetical protein
VTEKERERLKKRDAGKTQERERARAETERVKLLAFNIFMVFVEHAVHHHHFMNMSPNSFLRLHLLLCLLLSSATLCVSYEPRNHEGGQLQAKQPP